MKIKTPATRLTASLLALALVQLSFGPEAWAQMVPRVGDVAAPVGGAAAAAVSLNAGGLANPAALALPSAALLTGPSSPFLSAPSAAPALPISAIGGAAPAPGLAAAPVAAPAGEEDASAKTPAQAASPAAGTELESGPRTAGVASRMARPISELKDFLARRRDAGPAAAEPAAADGAGLSPAPDAAATKRMMGRYILGSNFTQAGYEGLASASMPVYLDQTFHRMSMMADISIVGTFASVVGRQLSPLIINSMPLKKSYLGLLGATFVAGAAIGALANLHALAVLPLFGLMIVFRLMQAGSSIAERTVIPSVLGKDQVAMENLRGSKQSWSEVASVLVQNGAAALIVLLGTATTNLFIAPFFYVAALAVLWRSLKISKDADAARLAAWREKTAQAGGSALARAKAVLKNFLKQIGLGYKVVMRDPALRASVMITTLMVLFNVMTYSLLGPAFGKFAAGPGADPSLAAPIMGLVVGLFSFGGLFAGKIVTKHARDIEAKHGADSASAGEAARASTMRWLKYGALSFLAAGAMALPLPVVGPLIQLGSHAAVAVTAVLGTGTILAMWKPKLGLALAMAPVVLAFPSHVALAAVAFFGFGLLQVVASLKNDSLFDKLVQEKAPADYANAAAFVGAFSMFAGVLGLAALKFMIYGSLPFGIPSPVSAFAGLPGIWPFVAVFAGIAVPSMLATLYFTRRLDRLTRADATGKK